MIHYNENPVFRKLEVPQNDNVEVSLVQRVIEIIDSFTVKFFEDKEKGLVILATIFARIIEDREVHLQILHFLCFSSDAVKLFQSMNRKWGCQQRIKTGRKTGKGN